MLLLPPADAWFGGGRLREAYVEIRLLVSVGERRGSRTTVARLGATNIQVGLLSAIPNLTGFLLAVPVGHLLQGRRNAVPWYSRGRFINQLSLAAIGLSLALQQAIFVWYPGADNAKNFPQLGTHPYHLTAVCTM